MTAFINTSIRQFVTNPICKHKFGREANTTNLPQYFSIIVLLLDFGSILKQYLYSVLCIPGDYSYSSDVFGIMKVFE